MRVGDLELTSNAAAPMVLLLDTRRRKVRVRKTKGKYNILICASFNLSKDFLGLHRVLRGGDQRGGVYVG